MPGEGPSSRPSVVFVFRPADCPGSLEIIERWNAEAQAGRIRVLGLLVSETSDTASLNAVVRSYRIGFVTHFARSDDISERLAQLGVTQLPVSLVFDDSLQLRAIAPSAGLSDDSLVRRATIESFR